jgi:phosphatidylserine/phosphatidylglycerophosphate/cardiolipin synthase-like enzyme
MRQRNPSEHFVPRPAGSHTIEAALHYAPMRRSDFLPSGVIVSRSSAILPMLALAVFPCCGLASGAPAGAGSAIHAARAGAAAPAQTRPATLPADRPVQLVETRPLETALGDPTLPTAQAEWLDMIQGARTTLDLEEFYFSERPGQALSPVIDALGAAARRGVHVRLLLDAGMHRTYPLPADSLGRLDHIAVRTVDYRRLAGGVQHAKFMIADARDAYVGSQNLDWRALSHIHELGVRVRLPEVAAAFEDVFETDWAAADTTTRAAPVERARAPWPLAFHEEGAAGELWVSASPRALTPASIPWDRDVVVARLAAARREIVLQSLTYGVGGHGVTDSTLHHALIDAAARGVHVMLLISDWELGGGGEASLRALAAVPNIEVRISRVPDWSGGYIPFARVEHCKYLVVDGEWLWVGTSNWEPGYFLTTRNLAVTVHHAPLARTARGIFERDWTGPTALRFGPETTLAPRPHGEQAPAGARVFGE